MDEFALIQRYFRPPAVKADLGGGDDAALFRVSEGHQCVISTDMLVEGRHFFPDVDPFRLGHKVLAVNLSDIAAMGATPRFVTLAMGMPTVDEHWLEAFSAGFLRLAAQHGVELIGGDTTRAAARTFSVTILGEIPMGQALRRDAAQVGDQIWVSGRLGSAALALQGILQPELLSEADVLRLREALERPTPRVVLGQAIRSQVHACMDVSDGLMGDLPHILRASQVGAVIEWERLPTDSLLKEWAYAERGDLNRRQIARQALLGGGDDYELLFTAAPTSEEWLLNQARLCGVDIACIGRIVSEQTLRLVGEGGQILPVSEFPQQGFNHFIYE